MKKLLTLLAVGLVATTLQAAPKKLLVVTTTTGFRHSSIPTLEKMLEQLGKNSGEFTVDLERDATDEQKAEHAAASKEWDEALKMALEKLSPESLKNYDGVVFAST